MAWNREKEFPRNFTAGVVDILRTMSFTDGEEIRIIGSAGLRSIQFAGDYDAFEVVSSKSLQSLERGFQRIVKNLLGIPTLEIGDIKCGEVAQYRVLSPDISVHKNSVQNYSQKESRAVVERLPIPLKEKEKALKLLPPTLSLKGYFEALDFFKFHIVRWTPEEVLQGSKKLADGSTYQLTDGFQSGKTKLDVVALTQDNRFVELSCVYEFKLNGKLINASRRDAEAELKESVLEKQQAGNTFKAAKRIFSVARLQKDSTTAQRLIPVFNGDLGRLYSVISDIQILQFLLENKSHLPKERMSEEIDSFKARLSNIWSIPEFVKIEPNADRQLDKAADNPKEAQELLERLEMRFQAILDDAAKPVLRKLGLFPVPRKYLP